MRIVEQDSPMPEENMKKAQALFDNYYNILKLTLSPRSLAILDELLVCREQMETYRCQEWYMKGLKYSEKQKGRD